MAWTLSRCSCKGPHLERRKQWRALSTALPPLSSLLKCLRCNRRWKSKCKYCARLLFHKEKKRPKITDLEVLKRIVDKTLLVNLSTASVVSITCHGRKQLTPVKSSGINGGSVYDFVTIYYRGGVKKVAVHKMVWIAANRRLPPEGFDIDHINGRDIINPHGIKNLKLIPSAENRSKKDSYREDF